MIVDSTILKNTSIASARSFKKASQTWSQRISVKESDTYHGKVTTLLKSAILPHPYPPHLLSFTGTFAGPQTLVD